MCIILVILDTLLLLVEPAEYLLSIVLYDL